MNIQKASTSAEEGNSSSDSKKKKTPLLIEAHASRKGKEKKSSQNATTSTKSKSQEEPLLIEAQSARTTKEKESSPSATMSIESGSKDPSSQTQRATMKSKRTTTQSEAVNLTEKDEENRKNKGEESATNTAAPVKTTTPPEQEQRNEAWYTSGNWTEEPELSNANIPSENGETTTSSEQKQGNDAWYTSGNWIEEPEDIRSMAHKIKDINFDQTIENIKIAEAYNVSPYLVDARKDFFSQKYFSDEMENTLRGAPKTAEWFNKSPNNAILTKDDLKNIAELERLLHLPQLARYDDIPLEKRDGTVWERLSLSGEKALRRLGIRFLDIIDTFPELFTTLSSPNVVQPFYYGPPPTLDIDKDLFYKYIKNKIKELEAKNQKYPFTEPGILMGLTEELVEGAPEMLATIVPTIRALALALFTTSDINSKRRRAEEAGASKEDALLAAIGSTAEEHLINKSMRAIAKKIPIDNPTRWKKTLNNILMSTATEMTTSLMAEYTNELAMLWAVHQNTDENPLNIFGKNFIDYSKRGVHNGLISLIYKGGHAGAKIGYDLARYQRQKLSKMFLEAVDKNVSELKNKKQLTNVFQEVVTHVSDGAPIKNLYIEPEKVRSSLGDEHRLSQWLDNLGISKKEFESLESLGIAIEIPFSIYLTKIAGTADALALRSNFKTSPEGMTLAEQRSFEKNAPQYIEEKVTEQSKILLEDEALSKDLAPIKQELTTLHGEEVAPSSVAMLITRAKVAAKIASVPEKEMTPREWLRNSIQLQLVESTENTAQNTQTTQHDAKALPKNIKIIDQPSENNTKNTENTLQNENNLQSTERSIDLGDKTLLAKQNHVGEKDSIPAQIDQGKKRSNVLKENETLIRGFKESTDIFAFVYETGHLFIKDMESIVATGSAPKNVVRNLHTLKELTGEFSDTKKLQAFYEKNYSKQRKEFSQRKFASLTEQEKKEVRYVAEQEKLANAFATYIQEGKAPSRELGSAFKQLRMWMQSMYKNVYGHTPINDKLLTTFDRMIASELEINVVEVVHSAHPEGRQALEKITSTMLDTKEQQQLVEARDQATAHSQQHHLQKELQVKARIKKERKKIYMQAQKEVSTMPVYAAQDKAIRQGGLNLTAIQQEYGKDTVKALQKRIPSLLRKQGTVSLNALATEYGFPSGQALIEAMQKAQGKKAEITLRANKKIHNKEQAIKKELDLDTGITSADKEYYSNHRLVSLELEARALKRSMGEKTISLGSVEELRTQARSILESLPYKERSIRRLSHAEAKQATRAEKALKEGDIETAVDAKLKQIINHAMILEAIELKKQEKNTPIQ